MSNFPTAPVAGPIPAALLAALHRATSDAVPAETAVQIVRSVGVESAQAVLDRFAAWSAAARMDSTAVADLAEGEFWSLLSEYFATLGWGSLRHEHLHPGVIAVSSSDLSEAGANTGAQGCHFTTGLLAELLRLIAGRDVAALEVECRSTGSASCQFLVGSPAALEAVYVKLRDGVDVPQAIAGLL